MLSGISVRDQGPGIPSGERGKLFGMFYKSSARPTAGERSAGLGPAIAKKVVEAHQGGISVDSEMGTGSVFTVSLPLCPPVLSAALQNLSSTRSSSKPSSRAALVA